MKTKTRKFFDYGWSLRIALLALTSQTIFAAALNEAEKTPSRPTQEQLSKLKDQLSALAVRIGKENYQIDLDYSVESVKKAEFILGKIHQDYKKTKNEEGLRGIAAEFGAYIIKVIEKYFEPGVWSRDHPAKAKAVFPTNGKGLLFFPWDGVLSVSLTVPTMTFG